MNGFYNMNNNMNINMNMNMNMNYNMNFNMNNNIINNNWNNNNNNLNNNMNTNINSININGKFQKLNKLGNLNNEIVNIFDCFEYIGKYNKISGMFCNYCQQITDSYYCTTLLTLPKVLILLFNRGTKDEFKIKLEFTEILDLNQYAGLQNSPSNKYKLIGIITHQGNNDEVGPFIAHCLSPIDREWYTYNGTIVSKITDIKKIIYFGMPYLLFYHKIDDNY